MTDGIDVSVIEGFGSEWNRFDQSEVDEAELRSIFEAYFRIFPWYKLPEGARGFDLGSGSGRWARFVAERVAELHVVEPSDAIEVAANNLRRFDNVVFHRDTAESMAIAEGSMDFGYSLGVLHHVSDTEGALRSCVRKLRPGAPFLVYLYYAFDNQPSWYRTLWRASDLGRRIVSLLPDRPKHLMADAIAVGIYFPLARAARLAEHVGLEVKSLPLSSYRNKSFYTMRTDALDRFGTRLEKRYSVAQIRQLMTTAGLTNIQVSQDPPYWCAVGERAASDG